VKPETELLQRYFDREMSAAEAERFRARLAHSPELRQGLRELQQVGALLRVWSGTAEARGADLLEPTLQRIRTAERLRSSYPVLACGVAFALLLVLRGSSAALPLVAKHLEPLHFASSAAIERVEASDQQAQVFVVGAAATPVVWLLDDALEEDGSPEQDPG
jgi:hypothetical protein